MFKSLTPAHRARTATAAIAGVAGLTVALAASPAGASSVPPPSDGTVTMIDAGDPSEQVDLNARPAVGAVATNTSESTVAGTLTLEGPRSGVVEIDVTTTVVEYGEILASDDTGVVMLRRVESYDVDDRSNPAGYGESFASDEELAELVGIDLERHIGPDNRLVDIVPVGDVELTPAQQAAVDEIIDDARDKADLPPDPIGVGAQWTASLPGQGDGAVVANYHLVSIADGEYTIEVTIEADGSSFFGANIPDGFDQIEGTVTGSGTLVGSVDEPLVRTTTLEMALDLTLTGEAGEMQMDLTMTEVESAVSSPGATPATTG